jgi:hypothetical protein
MALFISGRPSSRAHLTYQVGWHGNSSPPDPLTLSARVTCELPCRRSSSASGSMSLTRPLPQAPPRRAPHYPAPLFLLGKDEQCSPLLFFVHRSRCYVRPPRCFSSSRRLPSQGTAAPPSHCQALCLTPPLFCRPMPEPELSSAMSMSSIEPRRQH